MLLGEQDSRRPKIPRHHGGGAAKELTMLAFTTGGVALGQRVTHV